MKPLCISLVACLSIGLAYGEPAPDQAEARRMLEREAAMEEYPGSIYAQARIDGISYRPILRKAITLDPKALSELFKMQFAGEGGETHCENLLNLLHLWGDAKFANSLSAEEPKIRKQVVGNIEYAWGKPEWDRFTQTAALRSTSPKNQNQAEQSGAGQPATRSESDSEGSNKPQPESEGRSR